MFDAIKYDFVREITNKIHENLYILYNAKSQEEFNNIRCNYSERIGKLQEIFIKNNLATLQKIVNDAEYIKEFANEMYEFHVFEENIKAIMFSGRVTMQDIVKMYNDKFKPKDGSFQLDNFGNIVFIENLKSHDY